MNLEREFSKQYIPEERKKTADELRETRGKIKSDWQEWDKKDIEEIDNPELRENYENLKRDFIGRLFKTEEFLEKKSIFKSLARKYKREEQKQIQEEFNRHLSEVFKNTPLSKEEQDKYLSEEAVTSMSLDDYLSLMKRLSGYFATHVTRYGVREQTFTGAGGGHTRGENQFMDNFTPILESRRLNSFFSNLINETDYMKGVIKDRILREVQNEPGKDKNEIVTKVVQGIMESEQVSDIVHGADLSSVHFAVNDIAARYYGSEIDYNIYFHFPAEVIAKNYYHEEKSDTGFSAWNKPSGFWNDVGIWNKGNGIPINAGILCIPKNVMVDKETGSKFALNEEKQPIVNPEIAKHIEVFYQDTEKWYAAMRELKGQETSFLREHSYGNDERELFYETETFKQSWQKFSFRDEGTFRSYYEHFNFMPRLEDFYRKISKSYYNRPPTEHLVSTETFWESYFLTHPEKKPSKVFYYSEKELADFSAFSPINSAKRKETYDELFKEKSFTRGRDIPKYEEYLESVTADLEKAVSNIYDEVVVKSENPQE